MKLNFAIFLVVQARYFGNTYKGLLWHIENNPVMMDQFFEDV